MEKGQLPRIFCRTFTVAGAQLDGSQRRAAHSGECGKGRDQQDDGERNAHACQRKCACAGDVADVDPVHDIVQHVDELRGNGRQGKTEHQLANGLCAQRFVLVLQKNPLLFGPCGATPLRAAPALL